MQDKAAFEAKSAHDFVCSARNLVTLITSVIIVVLITNAPVGRQRSLNDDTNEDA